MDMTNTAGHANETPVLDELAHLYTLNGKPLTAVTKAIRSVWPNKPSFDSAPIDVLEHARQRGIRVDFWTSEYARLNGNVDVEDDADVVESVGFFDRWWSAVKPGYIDHQRMVWDEHFCGTFDLMLNIDGKAVIVDVKRTHKKEETWPLQVGAYRDLYHRCPHPEQFYIEEIAVLHLHPDFAKGYIYRKYDVNAAVEWWRATAAFYRTVREITA